jgi:trigger factor
MIQKELPTLREKLRPEAEREVRVSFLLEEIAKKEGLKAEPSDLEAKIKLAAARHRQPEEVVKKYYDEHAEAKEALEAQILHEKAIQLIKDHAK